MKYVNILSAGLVAAAAFAVLPAAAEPAPRCIDVKDIASADSKDGKTMTFRLKNGMTTINTLKTACDSLRFGGFVWNTSPIGEVCANAQTFRTLTTGEICRLGDFSALVKTAAK